jgi:ligand-binding sensor domain-containing protein
LTISFKHIIVLFLLSLFCLTVKSQVKSIGIPNIINFTKQNYNASTQNWDITQDKRGVMYFANNDGLIEFDGVNWRLMQMPNSSVVRSLVVDKSGRIYIGAFGEFGFLQATKNGQLHYVSLIEMVPEEIRNFGDIWKIHETDNGIIFQSFSEIFLYKDSKIKVIAQRRDFQFSFFVNNELYITERNKGLLKLEDEKLIPVKGGEIFKNNIWTMLPFSDTKILIGTSNHGLYILENDVIKVWNISVNDFFKQNQVFCGTIVKGYFAIGTILDGLLVIDKNGTPIQHINREKGLQNNTVLSIYADNYDNLWLGLDNGIDYVKINSPFTSIVSESKIGAGYVSYLFKDKLYLGTNQGLFYKKWIEPANPIEDSEDFKIVENTQGQVWDLFEYNNTLFCGHNNGTYIVNDNKTKLISDVQGGWLLFNLPDVENTMIQGTYFGLVKYKLNNSGWEIKKIPGFNESCRMIEYYLAKDKYSLWISHGYKGIYRVDLDKNLDSIIDLHFYDSLSGLSTNFDNNVLKFNNEIIFTNNKGIFNFDEEQQKFVPNNKLNQLFGDYGTLRRIVKDKNDQYWFIQGEELGLIKRLSDGSYKINRSLYKAFAGSFVRSFEHLSPYNNDGVIVATEDGFTHLSKHFVKDLEIPFNVLIRSIETTNDSLLFGGSSSDSVGQLINNQFIISQSNNLPFKLNNLRFEYSATHYENMNNIEYKYYLEGFDEAWSEWSNKTYKEYTNLHEGSYVFNVKAKNVFNIESQISTYQFIINPPWYRSVVSYFIYLLVLSTLVWLIIRIVKKRIDREKKLLQLKQKKELQQQKINHENEVLSAQQEIVKLRNEKLRIENEKNRTEVELKTKELASYAMQITQKNESLFDIKEQLNHISQKVNPDAQRYLQKLIKNIEQNTNQKDDWEKFEVYFDQVYENFTKRIREKFPCLTPADIKLCAYLRMNLSTKEIAPLLNISIRGVEIGRYRLRKKLNLPQNENLIDFMMNL